VYEAAMTMQDDSFDAKLIAALSAGGVELGPEGKFVCSGTGPATPEQVRYMNLQAARRQPDTHARQQANWVRNLDETARTLRDQGDAAPWPFMAIFWIRLHAVIADLRLELEGTFQRLGIDPATHQAQPHSPLSLAIATHQRIEMIWRRFTEDELVFIDCRRQTECHITQSSYDYRLGRANVVLDRRGVPTVGREFTVEELDAAVGRILGAYPDENAAAVALARKIVEALPTLVFLTRVGAGA